MQIFDDEADYLNSSDAKNVYTEVCLNDFILLYQKLKKRQGIFWVSLQGFTVRSFAFKEIEDLRLFYGRHELLHH